MGPLPEFKGHLRVQRRGRRRLLRSLTFVRGQPFPFYCSYGGDGSPDLRFSPSHKLFCWVGVGGQSHWCYIMVLFTSSPRLAIFISLRKLN
jgi:hypothetical protein